MRALSAAWTESNALADDVTTRLQIGETFTTDKSALLGAPRELLDNLDAGVAASAIVCIPPELQPVACKPLVFDLAVDGVVFPPYEDMMRRSEQLVKAERASTPGSAKTARLTSRIADIPSVTLAPSASDQKQQPAVEPKKSFFSRLWGS